jgi:hypothetical protein
MAHLATDIYSIEYVLQEHNKRAVRSMGAYYYEDENGWPWLTFVLPFTSLRRPIVGARPFFLTWNSLSHAGSSMNVVICRPRVVRHRCKDEPLSHR